jgi:hypothetical protein
VVNLFEQAEADMSFTLEDVTNGFGLPVELIMPDGVVQTTSANDATKPLAGRIDYGKTTIDPDTGEEFLIGNPTVALRLSSLDRVPQEGERKWAIRIPVSPSVSASKVTYMIDERGIFIDLILGRVILSLTKADNP